MSLESRIARARSKQATADLFQWPVKPSFIREVDNTEREAKAGNLFNCTHNVCYLLPCDKCKRTQQDADKQLAFYKATLRRVSKQLGLS